MPLPPPPSPTLFPCSGRNIPHKVGEFKFSYTIQRGSLYKHAERQTTGRCVTPSAKLLLQYRCFIFFPFFSSFGREPRFPAPKFPGPIFPVSSILYYQYICFPWSHRNVSPLVKKLFTIAF